MDILNLYCNRFGWQHSVVEAAHSREMLDEWARERKYALNNLEDYNTVTAIIPWTKG